MKTDSFTCLINVCELFSVWAQSGFDNPGGDVPRVSVGGGGVQSSLSVLISVIHIRAVLQQKLTRQQRALPEKHTHTPSLKTLITHTHIKQRSDSRLSLTPMAEPIRAVCLSRSGLLQFTSAPLASAVAMATRSPLSDAWYSLSPACSFTVSMTKMYSNNYYNKNNCKLNVI